MSEPEVHQDAPFVFLSHTGRDSRMKGIMWLVKTVLTDELHLLQRQQVFFDQSNLDAGRSNSTQMDNAAARSTIGVAFLSPTYLERRWCVHELAVFLCKEDLLPLQDAGTQALNQLKPISPAYHKDRKLSLANVALRPSAPASAANRVLLTIFWNTRPEDVGGTESPHMSEDFQERLRQRLSSYPDSDRVVLTSGKVDDQGDMEEIEWLVRDVLPAIIVRLGRAVPPTSQLRAACRSALMLDDDKEDYLWLTAGLYPPVVTKNFGKYFNNEFWLNRATAFNKLFRTARGLVLLVLAMWDSLWDPDISPACQSQAMQDWLRLFFVISVLGQVGQFCYTFIEYIPLKNACHPRPRARGSLWDRVTQTVPPVFHKAAMASNFFFVLVYCMCGSWHEIGVVVVYMVYIFGVLRIAFGRVQGNLDQAWWFHGGLVLREMIVAYWILFLRESWIVSLLVFAIFVIMMSSSLRLSIFAAVAKRGGRVDFLCNYPTLLRFATVWYPSSPKRE